MTSTRLPEITPAEQAQLRNRMVTAGSRPGVGTGA